MELVILIAFLVAVAFTAANLTGGKWRETLQAFGQRHDLDAERDALSGSIEGVMVRIDKAASRHDKKRTVTRVTAETDLPPDLDLGKETLGSTLGKALFGSDLLVGDPGFDHKVLVRAHEHAPAIASLSGPARTLIAQEVDRGMRFADGKARVYHRGMVKDLPTLEALVKRVVDIGKATKASADSVAGRLAYNALNDPVQAVRVRNFEFLTGRLRRTKEARACAAKLAKGDDPQLRALASQLLKDDEARASLEGALIDGHANNALAQGHVYVADQLAERFPDAAVLHTIKPWLVTQLQNTPEAAATALGAFADIDVVEAMLGVARGSAKKPVREAIARIQARSSGGLGQLAVVEPDVGTGGLSVAEQPGHVSLATEVAEADLSEI